MGLQFPTTLQWNIGLRTSDVSRSFSLSDASGPLDVEALVRNGQLDVDLHWTHPNDAVQHGEPLQPCLEHRWQSSLHLREKEESKAWGHGNLKGQCNIN